jgi:hypothetical protein
VIAGPEGCFRGSRGVEASRVVEQLHPVSPLRAIFARPVFPYAPGVPGRLVTTTGRRRLIDG